jgi:transmembrane 9 superfamily protein 3
MLYAVGIVGEMEDDEGTASYSIWTHKKFDIGYNGKQIVDVNLTSENKVKLKLDAKIPFTYEVNWKRSSIKFEDRFDKYLDPNFFQHRVSSFLMFCIFYLSVFGCNI